MRFALFACFARTVLLAGNVKAATGKACNECKHLVNWTGLCLNARTVDTNVVWRPGDGAT